MPGFPDADQEGLKSIQDFDAAAAKALLADAGFPDGQGFPPQTLVIRGGGPETTPAVTQAVAASIAQTLGVQIDLQTVDQGPFMEQLRQSRASRSAGSPTAWTTSMPPTC